MHIVIFLRDDTDEMKEWVFDSEHRAMQVAALLKKRWTHKATVQVYPYQRKEPS